MAQFEIMTLNEGVPQLLAPGAGDTYLAPAPIAVTGNVTANNFVFTSTSGGLYISGGGNFLTIDAEIMQTVGAVSLGNGNARLFATSANILEQRNGRTAQRFRVYNDFNGSSDGEWFDVDWQTTANVCTIGPRANGTGTVRPLKIVGTVLQVPPASVTLSANGELAIECTSNTAGNIVFRGSDGTTRRMALTFS